MNKNVFLISSYDGLLLVYRTTTDFLYTYLVTLLNLFIGSSSVRARARVCVCVFGIFYIEDHMVCE